jgi:monovalent cation:H+ antiporter-2, CPA2 family
VATTDPSETRLIVERAQALQPGLDFVVRTHSDMEAAQLRALGSKIQVVHGERELAVQMARYALRRFGVSATEAEAIAQGLRGRSATAPPVGATGSGRAWWIGVRDRLRRRSAE